MTSTLTAPFVARRMLAPPRGAVQSHDRAMASVPVEAVDGRPGAALDERLGAHLDERPGAADFGPLASYLRDRSVTDVFINGPADLWFDRGGGLVRDPTWSCPGEAELRQLAVRLIALGGRHVDEANPCVDVRLHDGVRLHAVLPPAAPRGTVISIRIPPVTRLRLDDLDQSAFFSGSVSVERVRSEVAARSNILITGAGGSGKTTLMAALLSEAAADERIVAIEDVSELRVEHPHFVSLEARQANLEGAGEISLQRLLREALRMRPDRLVLGECRGPEVRELLSALNTGHDGGAGTLHANSLPDVAARIEALGALAGLTPEAVARQAVSAIQTVFHVEQSGGRRRLAAVGHLALDAHGRLVVQSGRSQSQSQSPSQSQSQSQPGSESQASPLSPSPHPFEATAVSAAESTPGRWSAGSGVGAAPYDIGSLRTTRGRHA
ncbi:TadA family conjugal transfer-associated ATPase [Subtercola sp. YIM 133946]|uniref:TadA family conjugal transfer-associated ATPase n=1 Tax=Subtercola sp. YIM 133946 TaxID=3118909 RepID=UPI002F932F26